MIDLYCRHGTTAVISAGLHVVLFLTCLLGANLHSAYAEAWPTLGNGPHTAQVNANASAEA